MHRCNKMYQHCFCLRFLFEVCNTHGSNVNPLKSGIRAVSGKITGFPSFEVVIDETCITKLRIWFPLKTSFQSATMELQREPKGP